MIKLLIAIIIAGGGYFAGSHVQKKKCRTQTELLLLKNDKLLNDLTDLAISFDSLKTLPPKVDTIIEVVTDIQIKIDTFVLIGKNVLANTDTIKHEIRELRNEIKNE